MSLEVNTQLFERAAECIDYWEGKIIAELIEADLDRNDLKALAYHVTSAEAMAAQEEFEAADVA